MDYKETHVFERLLPTISMYLTLLENDFTKEEALEMAHKEIQHHARSMAEENAKLTKIPFTYSLFKMFAKSVVFILFMEIIKHKT